MSDERPVRRARHLLDPANPRPSAPQRSGMPVETVQKYVLSVLAATTILHLSIGLVIAALLVDDTSLGTQVGLNIIAAGFGVVAVFVARAIHGKAAVSPWLLLGLVPGLVGIAICLR